VACMMERDAYNVLVVRHERRKPKSLNVDGMIIQKFILRKLNACGPDSYC